MANQSNFFFEAVKKNIILLCNFRHDTISQHRFLSLPNHNQVKEIPRVCLVIAYLRGIRVARRFISFPILHRLVFVFFYTSH